MRHPTRSAPGDSRDTRGARARAFFGLTPEIVAVSTAMFMMGLGENLWRRFLPKYLESLGAPITAIGLFGTSEDFLDGVYQYPGGWVADRYGRRAALVTLAVSWRIRIPVVPDKSPVTIGHMWRSFPRQLRWLLAADVFIRTCDAMVDVFLVLFAVNVIGISAPRFGILVAVQAATAMVVYIPAARIAERAGKKPFVTATFVAFALFPVAVVLCCWHHRTGGGAALRCYGRGGRHWLMPDA